MSSTVRLVTADELLRMPDDGFRYELVKGELKKSAFSGEEHGIVAMSFDCRLAHHVKINNLGAVTAGGTGFLLASHPDTVRAADGAFVNRKRIEETGRLEGYRPGAPDLAVEVMDFQGTYHEVAERAIEWLAAGSQMVLILIPSNRTATAYRSLKDVTILNEDDVLDIDDVVKGFKVRVKDIFE